MTLLFDDLVAYTNTRPQAQHAGTANPQGYERLAELCGVTTRTIQRWRKTGRVPDGTVDTIACRLGLHPLNLDPNWEGKTPLGATRT